MGEELKKRTQKRRGHLCLRMLRAGEDLLTSSFERASLHAWLLCFGKGSSQLCGSPSM
jgi:hypothetical protein